MGVSHKALSSLYMNSYASRTLKKLRVSQPLNYLMTTSVRTLLRATGVKSEFAAKHLHRAGVSECELPNGRKLKLWSRGDDWVSTQIFWHGLQGYEPETTHLFYKLAARASITFDIGAYVGFFTLLAAHANPRGKVFAFEPMPNIYNRLQKNVALNKLTNVECARAAISDRSGTAEFYTAGMLPSSSSLSFEFMENVSGLRKIKVEVLTIDEYVGQRNIGPLNLVKIDTESTEPQVLRGMRQTILRDRPTIICEVLKGRGSEKPVEEFFRSLDYRFYLLTPTGPVRHSHIECHPEWLNYLFISPESRDPFLDSILKKADAV